MAGCIEMSDVPLILHIQKEIAHAGKGIRGQTDLPSGRGFSLLLSGHRGWIGDRGQLRFHGLLVSVAVSVLVSVMLWEALVEPAAAVKLRVVWLSVTDGVPGSGAELAD